MRLNIKQVTDNKLETLPTDSKCILLRLVERSIIFVPSLGLLIIFFLYMSVCGILGGTALDPVTVKRCEKETQDKGFYGTLGRGPRAFGIGKIRDVKA